MSLSRHPDPAIEAWLSDGPVVLSSTATIAIKATARQTRQRSRTVVPVLPTASSRRVLLVAATLTLLGAGLAALAGIQPPTDLPAPSGSPASSGPPGPSASPRDHVVPSEPDPGSGATIRGEAWTQLLQYSVPDDWDLDITRTGVTSGQPGAQGVAFTLDGVGPYDTGPDRQGTPSPAARGIVVAEVTGATAHNPEPVGVGGPRRFLERLQEVTYYRFTVGQITETTVAGFPALAADVIGGHLDDAAELDFGRPSRAIVAGVHGGILVIQIWATSPGALEAWLPDAMAFVSTFQLAAPMSAACWSNPAVPVDLSESGRLTLPGTSISIDYTIPAGMTLSAESQPGVVGMAEGGSGLSYNSGPTSPGRGIVIGEAKSASRHASGTSSEPAFGIDADSIFRALANSAQFEIRSGNVLDAPGAMVGPGGMFHARAGIEPLRAHIDRVGPEGRDCLVDFTRPNATYFVDVEGEVVVLQVWAMSDAALSAWLTPANGFIETLRFVVGDAPG